jgi:hypothetical protein
MMTASIPSPSSAMAWRRQSRATRRGLAAVPHLPSHGSTIPSHPRAVPAPASSPRRSFSGGSGPSRGQAQVSHPRRCFRRVAAARRRGAGGDGSVERVCGGGASGGRRRRQTYAGADWVGFSPGSPFIRTRWKGTDGLDSLWETIRRPVNSDLPGSELSRHHIYV